MAKERLPGQLVRNKKRNELKTKRFIALFSLVLSSCIYIYAPAWILSYILATLIFLATTIANDPEIPEM